jgi:glutathione-regulated potassium-efflux system ancillary protein KefG
MSDPHTRILVLFAHPNLDASEVNRPLARATRRMADVTFVELYAEYPDMFIDVEREQETLRNHDIIVFMHPIYWYSTPAILKQWQDLVLEYGFAYGTDGTALNGKILFCAVTTGGLQDAYDEDGYNNFTLRELLRPIEQTAYLCGMTYLPPFVLHGARRAQEEGRIGTHVAEWRRLVSALQADRLNIHAAQKLDMLTGHLDALTRRG